MSASAPAASCPVCDARVPLGQSIVLSELVRCRDCGSDLEVTALDPVSLAEAPTEEEDWGQ